jgi:hypothetical protein
MPIDTRRLTVEEIALMRAIVRWRRQCGITLDQPRATYRAPDGAYVTWDNEGEMGVARSGFGRRHLWYPVSSLTEAVDLLVALRYLPDQFCTAYRRGYSGGLGNGALAACGADIDRSKLPAVLAA